MPTATVTRRTLFAAALPFGLSLLPRRAAAQAPSRAISFIKTTSDQLIAVINGPGSVADKRPHLQRIIDATVDVEEIGRFSLGRFWRTASPEQQKDFLKLYHAVLLNNISGKIGEYQGVKITINRAQPRDDTEVVSSTVERPNSPPAVVDWVVGNPASAPKIVDLVAEGTSMRLTQRSDYAAFLGRNNGNVQALLEAMRQQLARNA